MGALVISESANVAESAQIAESAQVWGNAQIRENASVAGHVVVGMGAYIGVGVTVGSGSKIQNGAQIYEPAYLGRGVFIGPGVILTNDRFPRAVTPLMVPKAASDWDPVGVKILDGASVGAGSVCVAPITIGRWAMVAAGSVVVRDIPDHGLVVGNPARQIGWVGRFGKRLIEAQGIAGRWVCPVTEDVYVLTSSGMELLSGSDK